MRSPTMRYLLAAGALWVAYVLAFGDPVKWRSAPSLQWLAQAPIPFDTWPVLFVVYACLLQFSETRPVGFVLGFLIWAAFDISLMVTIGTAGPKSAPAIVALAHLAIFHAYAARTAKIANDLERTQREKRQRGEG